MRERHLTGGMMPYDWPSHMGALPSVSMTMWQVSPVALAPTMRSTERTLTDSGSLFFHVFMGISPSSSSSGSDSATLSAADVTIRAALGAGALRAATALPLNDFFCAPQ
jgi:hypothetical protein